MDQAERLRDMTNKNLRIITVASGKGGVGKTNFTVNLALELQKKGNRVIIIDADFGFANVDVILGVIPRYNLLDMIKNNFELNEILTKGPFGVQFISGASEIKQLVNFSKVQMNHFIKSIAQLRNVADVVIIDTGAGITDTALDFMKSSDDIIIITTPEPTAITDAYILLKTIKLENLLKDGKCDVHFVINIVDNAKEGNEIFNKFRKVSKRFLNIKVNYLGYIPFDRNVMKAVKMQNPLSISMPRSKAVHSIKSMAANLINSSKPKERKGIYSLISNIIGRN